MHRYLIYQGMLRLKEQLNHNQNDFTEVISIFKLARQNLPPQESDFEKKDACLETAISDLNTIETGTPSRHFLMHLKELENTCDIPSTVFTRPKKRNF